MDEMDKNVRIVESLSAHVRRVMEINDITSGDQQQEFVIRYRGRILVDPQEAFSLLDPEFSDKGMTLIMREEQGQQEILGLPGVIAPQPSNPWVNFAFFILTVISMLFAGAQYGLEGPVENSFSGIMTALFGNIQNGFIFTGSLLGILTAHEFGHYFAARFHRTEVSLPYFIPFPSLFGTMGAFIRLKEPPRNRRVLLDIGIAGPLAGLVVAIPVLLIGIGLSEIGSLPSSTEAAMNTVLEGNSLLYLGAKYLVTGELLPMPRSYGGLPPFIYWVRYFFVGLPMPLGGRDILMHPMAWAGWAGLLVTSLNLIPAGQLDGGHAIYVLLGKGAARLRPYLLLILLLMGFIWQGWLIWAILIYWMGRTYAVPRDDLTELNPGRKAVAVMGLLIFLLVFTPVPLRIF